VLLWCEQGLGDAIQFARYAPLVRDRGGRVLLECPPALHGLFAGLAGVEQLVAEGERLPPFDLHAPLMSLPHLFQTTLATVPAAVPYLAADADRVGCWRGRLPAGNLRVGVAWQGNPRHKWDRHRSFPPHDLAPLAAVPGVVLVSLQKDHGPEAQRGAPPLPLTLLGDDLDADAPFLDTAAVMTQLDLVVSADTAAAHLAGALGVPVWLALSAITDWRWLRGRDDSPWYPTARLFRQRALGDWAGVFERMAAELAERAGRPRPGAVLAPVSPGELIDKLTTLAVKAERVTDATERAHARAELAALQAVRARAVGDAPAVGELTEELRAVNEALWDVEDALRGCEQDGDAGPRFVELARSARRHNAARSRLRERLDDLLGAAGGAGDVLHDGERAGPAP
jgi:hypothetical protein